MEKKHQLGPMKKSDLQYTYPNGPTSDDDPSMRGEPDSSLLNRSEWYEVLYFVNKFANDCGKGSKDIALRAERLIQQEVPRNLHSHKHIQDWLIENWQSAQTV